MELRIILCTFASYMYSQLESIVVHGQQLGRKIGYPTANLGLEMLVGEVPETGVYATRCILQDGRQYKAMLNVGYRPTVNSDDHQLSIEAHILGFDEDIYGQKITLVITKRIRDERKMNSLADLSSQLARDLEEVARSLTIRNIVFDFGKVLVDYDFMPVLRQIIPDEERLAEFGRLFATQEFIDLCEKEDEPFHDIIQRMRVRYPQFDAELEEYFHRFPEFVTGEVPGMRQLLLQLKSEGYHLYGLTNWCSCIHTTLKQYDIFNLLDGMVISSDEHLIKPDRAIYECLCQRYQLNPSECVFTDDKPVNVNGAISTGMYGIVFRNAQQFEQELRTYITS